MRRLGLLLVVVLLAGCFGGQPDGPGDGPTTTGSGSSSTTTAPPPPAPPVVDLLLGFALEDCVGLTLRHTAPIADVQALLPAGFTARPGDFGDGTGTLVIDLYACGNLTASSARVPATYFGHLYTPILPPADRVPGTPEAATHEYVFRLLAGEDVLASLWPAAGYETRGGAATVRVGPPAGAVPVDAGLRTGEAGIAAGYSLGATGATSVPAPMTGTFARYTALADGSVLVWTGTYAFADSYAGQGMAQVPDDDPFDRFEAADSLGGVATMHEAGAMLGMDLRRVFTPL